MVEVARMAERSGFVVSQQARHKQWKRPTLLVFLLYSHDRLIVLLKRSSALSGSFANEPNLAHIHDSTFRLLVGANSQSIHSCR